MRYLFLILATFFLACESDAQLTAYQGPSFYQAGDGKISEFYDDTKQICLLLGGQSNMVGSNNYSPVVEPYDSILSGVFICMNTTTDEYDNLYFFEDGIENNGGNDIGPEMSLGYTLEAAFNRPVLMAKVAQGGAGITPHASPGFAPATGSGLYTSLKDAGLSLQDKCTALGKDPVVILVWNQGEAETANLTLANLWQQSMDNIMDTLAMDGVNVDYVIISYLSENASGLNAGSRDVVRSQQRNFVESSQRFRGLDLTPFALNGDNVHFSAPGQLNMGIAYSSIITNQIFSGFEPEAMHANSTTVINNINASLPAAYQTAINDFIVRLTYNDAWSHMREMQCRFLDTEANSLKGWKGVANGTNTGATFTAKFGFTYNGTTNFVSTGFTPSTSGGGVYALNDNVTGWYVIRNDALGTDGTVGGVFNGASNRVALSQVPSLGNLTYRVMHAAASTTTSQTYLKNNSLYTIGRSAASGTGAHRLRWSGLSLTAGNQVSTALPAIVMYEGGLNSAGSLTSPWAGVVGFTFWASLNGLDIIGMTPEIKKFYTKVQAIP